MTHQYLFLEMGFISLLSPLYDKNLMWTSNVSWNIFFICCSISTLCHLRWLFVLQTAALHRWSYNDAVFSCQQQRSILILYPHLNISLSIIQLILLGFYKIATLGWASHTNFPLSSLIIRKPLMSVQSVGKMPDWSGCTLVGQPEVAFDVIDVLSTGIYIITIKLFLYYSFLA